MFVKPRYIYIHLSYFFLRPQLVRHKEHNLVMCLMLSCFFGLNVYLTENQNVTRSRARSYLREIGLPLQDSPLFTIH